MNDNEFKEASEYINKLEKILIENTNISKSELITKSNNLAMNYGCLKTTEQKEQYLHEYCNVISDLIYSNDLGGKI